MRTGTGTGAGTGAKSRSRSQSNIIFNFNHLSCLGRAARALNTIEALGLVNWGRGRLRVADLGLTGEIFYRCRAALWPPTALMIGCIAGGGNISIVA